MDNNDSSELPSMTPWNEAVLRGIALFTVNNAQSNRWENIIATDQYRVLSILTMSDTNMRNRWGDTPEVSRAVMSYGARDKSDLCPNTANVG